MTADTAVLPTLLTALRLPSIARNWKRIAEIATPERRSHSRGDTLN